jgi:hypothetical protein
VDLDDVSRIAARLPGSEEKPSGGGLAWFVRRKPYAWESMPWPSESERVRAIVASETCIGVTVASEDDKRALLQGWPEAILTSDTNRAAGKIIIRLAAIEADHLAELVTESWRTQAPRYLSRGVDGRLEGD